MFKSLLLELSCREQRLFFKEITQTLTTRAHSFL